MVKLAIAPCRRRAVVEPQAQRGLVAVGRDRLAEQVEQRLQSRPPVTAWRAPAWYDAPAPATCRYVPGKWRRGRCRGECGARRAVDPSAADPAALAPGRPWRDRRRLAHDDLATRDRAT